MRRSPVTLRVRGELPSTQAKRTVRPRESGQSWAENRCLLPFWLLELGSFFHF